MERQVTVKKRILSTIIFNIVVCAGLQIFMYPQYATEYDAFLIGVANGNMPFALPLVSFFYSLAMLFSLTVLSLILLSKAQDRVIVQWIIAIVILGIGYEVYCDVNLFKAACLVTAVGTVYVFFIRVTNFHKLAYQYIAYGIGILWIAAGIVLSCYFMKPAIVTANSSGFIRWILAQMNTQLIFYLIILQFSLMAVFSKNTFTKWLQLVGVVITVVAAEYLLFYFQHTGSIWMNCGILIYLTVIICWIMTCAFSTIPMIIAKQSILFVLLFMLVLFQKQWITDWRIENTELSRYQKKTMQAYDDICNAVDSKIYVNTELFGFCYYGPWTSIPTEISRKIVVVTDENQLYEALKENDTINLLGDADNNIIKNTNVDAARLLSTYGYTLYQVTLDEK